MAGMHRPEANGSGPAEDLSSAALSLARRFAGGATMWCVAPQWPAHARHVAVEFVHPVIVGKRALPAVSLDGAGAGEAVRLLGRPGDILLVVGTATDPVASDLMARADAWGLTSKTRHDRGCKQDGVRIGCRDAHHATHETRVEHRLLIKALYLINDTAKARREALRTRRECESALRAHKERIAKYITQPG